MCTRYMLQCGGWDATYQLFTQTRKSIDLLPTPPKTNMTIKSSNHLKMYLLLKMVIFAIITPAFAGCTL